MSLVATPRRAPFADRQPLCAAPSALTLDLRSPTPRERKKQPQHQSKLASAVPVTYVCRSTVPKRTRDDENDATTSVSKKSRLSTESAAASATSTTVTDSTRGPLFVTPPPPDINTKVAMKEKHKDETREQKRTREERAEREKEIRAWNDKYTRAFPSFSFYFHGLDSSTRKTLSAHAQSFGARVEDFFSSSVTHVISDRPRPSGEEAEKIINNKENKPPPPPSALLPATTKPTSRGNPSVGPLRSPIKLRSTNTTKGADNDSKTAYDPLIVKAIELKMKVWNSNKLESVVNRLLAPSAPSQVAHSHMLPPRPTATAPIQGKPSPKPKAFPKAKAFPLADTKPAKPSPTLSHLLLAEKNSGITAERDPNTKRPDYDYFPKNTYFLLIQDCEDHYTPVAVKDYGRWRKGEKPGWPVLNLDGVGYTEREIERGRASVFGWKPEMDTVVPPVRRKTAPTPATAEPIRKAPDLRKAVSMQNLGLAKSQKQDLVKPGRTPPTAARSPLTRDLLHPNPTFRRLANAGASRASGASFGSGSQTLNSAMASQGPTGAAYLAASGNSAIITSNIASTTSTAPIAKILGTGLPGAIAKRLHQEVLTKRTFGKSVSAVAGPSNGGDAAQGTVTADAATVRPHVLKKSKSTNTLRLPPREETKKPGYCENCRFKFEDFSKHIRGQKHMRFANNRNNFIELDDSLDRVRRKTIEEWEEENEIPLSDSSSSSDESDSECEDEQEKTSATQRDEDTVGDILNRAPDSSFSNNDTNIDDEDEDIDVAMAFAAGIIARRKYVQNHSPAEERGESSSLSSLSDDEEEGDDSTLQWDEEADDEEMDDLALKEGDSERLSSNAYQNVTPSYDDMELGEDVDDLDDF